MELRRTKVKCAHCQGVHHFKFECEDIKALKRFAGHDAWQRIQDRKQERRNKRVAV